MPPAGETSVGVDDLTVGLKHRPVATLTLSGRPGLPGVLMVKLVATRKSLAPKLRQADMVEGRGKPTDASPIVGAATGGATRSDAAEKCPKAARGGDGALTAAGKA